MSRIEQYLQDFQKALPPHLRREAVAEVHSHLEELTRDWQRRGLSRAEAEGQAVRQFGTPRQIGNQWRAAGIVDWPDILLAALPILGITGLGWYFAVNLFPGHLSDHLGAGALMAWWRRWPTWWYAWLGWHSLAGKGRNSMAFLHHFPNPGNASGG
jgi:hypothetical protein